MAYDHVPFPLSLERCISQTLFNTHITVDGNGNETRVANWDDGLLLFNAMPGVRSLADLRALDRFHKLRRGSARSFYVHDLLDCQANDDGGDMALDVLGDNTAGPFQLTKTYEDDANAWIREITKPEEGTIEIRVNGSLKTENTHYTIDYQTGLVTFLASHFPPVSATIEWRGRFVVPVRFAEDKLPIQDVFLNMKPDDDGQWVLLKDATANLPEILLVEDRAA